MNNFQCADYILKDGGFPGGSVLKNLPAVQEMWVPSLGWEDPLEEKIATYSSFPVWGNPMDRRAWWATVHGVAELDTTERQSRILKDT